MNTYLPSTDNVKSLGRTCFVDNTLWLAFSGSGASFHFKGTRAQVTFLADDTASVPGNEDNHARVAVYVNGSRVVDTMMDQPRKEYVIIVAETEDVTRAYAYRTAQALDVDYSMVSLSGYGIISGYVGENEPQKPEK